MNVLIDTCVVVDFLQKRQPFANVALRLFQRMAMDQFTGFITAKSATDIFYLAHRNNHSNTESRKVLQGLTQIIGVLDTTADDVRLALLSDISDYEDAVMVETGKRTGVDCIVTRNTKDYLKCPLPVYEPEELLHTLEESDDEDS